MTLRNRALRVNRSLVMVGALVLAGVGAGYLAGRARAALPTTEVLTYAAVLTDTSGTPLTGAKNVQLQLWDAATDGNMKCSVGPTSMTLVGGAIQVGLPANCVSAVQATGDAWVEVIINGESLGRSKLGAVPYALEASHAASADVALTPSVPTIVTGGDTRNGCPSASPAGVDLSMVTLVVAKNNTPVHLSGDDIRYVAGRADLQLILDGNEVKRTLTYTPSAQWAPAHVEWNGQLAAGSHTASLRGVDANIWGCGTTYGALTGTIYQ
jgi:hypothetical protein